MGWMPLRFYRVNDPWLVIYFYYRLKGLSPVESYLYKRFDKNDVDFKCLIRLHHHKSFRKIVISLKYSWWPRWLRCFRECPRRATPLTPASIDLHTACATFITLRRLVPTPPSFRFVLLLDFLCPSRRKAPPIYSSLVLDDYGRDDGFNYSRIQPIEHTTQFYHRKCLCFYQKRTWHRTRDSTWTRIRTPTPVYEDFVSKRRPRSQKSPQYLSRVFFLRVVLGGPRHAFSLIYLLGIFMAHSCSPLRGVDCPALPTSMKSLIIWRLVGFWLGGLWGKRLWRRSPIYLGLWSHGESFLLPPLRGGILK